MRKLSSTLKLKFNETKQHLLPDVKLVGLSSPSSHLLVKSATYKKIRKLNNTRMSQIIKKGARLTLMTKWATITV